MENDEESKIKFIEKLGALIENPPCGWVSEEMWGHWLPIDNFEEGEEAFKWILKMRDFHCSRFLHEKHEEIDGEFKYVATENDIILKEVLGAPGKYTLGIKYKIGMKFI